MVCSTLAPILECFWSWLGITPEDYAQRDGDLEEYMFPQWERLISSAEAAIALEAIDYANELWTAIALDNEQETLLDVLSDRASDDYLDQLILVAPTHPQYHARWQATELIRRRPTPNGLSVLNLLCRDKHPYVAKRAQNTRKYLADNATL